MQTEFSKTCIQLSNDLKKSGHGELISKSDGKYIEAIDFSKILLRISKYDLSKEDKYELEKVESVKSSKLIWKIKNPKNIKRLEKLTFKAISGPGITIIDYDVYRITKPNHIHLRVLEGEFEELTIDKMKYSEFFEI
ncbi:MAG: hypothetical protein EOO93_27555 [Pedobacter sp.]|nr:MAG: hypothetical protein EOO93_27555 [Pedobacter sp.]